MINYGSISFLGHLLGKNKNIFFHGKISWIRMGHLFPMNIPYLSIYLSIYIYNYLFSLAGNHDFHKGDHPHSWPNYSGQWNFIIYPELYIIIYIYFYSNWYPILSPSSPTLHISHIPIFGVVLSLFYPHHWTHCIPLIFRYIPAWSSHS